MREISAKHMHKKSAQESRIKTQFTDVLCCTVVAVFFLFQTEIAAA